MSKTYTPEDLKVLWLDFGNIPVNDEDEIEEPFLNFPVGTYRFDIWLWFDERYPGGVKQLIDDTGTMY